MPEVEDKTIAGSASTWMQVVFSGLGVSIAIAALIIGYFAWVQPHSADGVDGQRGDPPRPNAETKGESGAGGSARTPLATLTPSVGAANLHPDGQNLVIPCASGENSDRERTIEYELLGHYSRFDAQLSVPKAHDRDSPLQLRIFVDAREAARESLTKDSVTRMSVTLNGEQKMRIQLTCQFPDGEIRLENPMLTHI